MIKRLLSAITGVSPWIWIGVAVVVASLSIAIRVLSADLGEARAKLVTLRQQLDLAQQVNADNVAAHADARRHWAAAIAAVERQALWANAQLRQAAARKERLNALEDGPLAPVLVDPLGLFNGHGAPDPDQGAAGIRGDP